MVLSLPRKIAKGGVVGVLALTGIFTDANAGRQFEYLDRGIIAVRQSNTAALVTWRSLATDDSKLGFNVYRTTDGVTTKLNSDVITTKTNFVDATADFTKANTYSVKKVLDGVELDTKGTYTMPANKGVGAYVTVPVGNIAADSVSAVHFVWVGDLDGDGAYDYVLDQPGLNHQQLQAYTSEGKYLWTLDLGANSENKNNISPGASTIDVGMWDGATVYDIDMDGYAEVLVRIADGVTFGDGKKYSNSTTNGQAVAVLDGRTGALKYSAAVPDNYISVGPVAAMMEIGYLDGVNPSLVCWFKNRNSDKTFNSMMVAYGMSNGKFVQRWIYDATKQGGGAEAHQIRIADVDYDGKDEVLHMGYALNGDGTLRYQMPLVVHGDRWYVGAFNKGDKVMMGYGIQQDHPNNLLEYYYNASTGEIIWTHYGDESCNGECDVARGNVGDIDPNYSGLEVWSFQGTYNAASNKQVSAKYMYPVIRYWWDGDLAAESYNDGKIEKWHYQDSSTWRLATTWKIYGSSGSERGAAMFHGDVFGDWREESILVNYATKELVIFTTDVESDYKFYTHMQNPCYRNGTTTKGYVQASMLDYFLGFDMDTPAKPNIEIIGGDREASFTEKAFLMKCGAGSRNQSVEAGNAIADYCFAYGNGTLKIENLIDGIDLTYGSKNDTNYVYFKGTVPTTLASGEYVYSVTVTGALNDTTVTGKYTITNSALESSSSEESKTQSSSGTAESSSSEESGAESLENSSSSNTMEMTGIQNLPANWTLERNGGYIRLNSTTDTEVKLFDMNGRHLHTSFIAAGASWQIPESSSPTLMQIRNESGMKMVRLGAHR